MRFSTRPSYCVGTFVDRGSARGASGVSSDGFSIGSTRPSGIGARTGHPLGETVGPVELDPGCVRGGSGVPRYGCEIRSPRPAGTEEGMQDASAPTRGYRDVDRRCVGRDPRVSRNESGIRSPRPPGLGRRIRDPLAKTLGYQDGPGPAGSCLRAMREPLDRDCPRHSVARLTTGMLRDHWATSALSGSRHAVPARSASAWRCSVCGSSYRTVSGPMVELPGRSSGSG